MFGIQVMIWIPDWNLYSAPTYANTLLVIYKSQDYSTYYEIRGRLYAERTSARTS